MLGVPVLTDEWPLREGSILKKFLGNQCARINKKKIEQIKHEIPENHGPNVYCKSFHYAQRLFHFTLLFTII